MKNSKNSRKKSRRKSKKMSGGMDARFFSGDFNEKLKQDFTEIIKQQLKNYLPTLNMNPSIEQRINTEIDDEKIVDDIFRLLGERYQGLTEKDIKDVIGEYVKENRNR